MAFFRSKTIVLLVIVTFSVLFAILSGQSLDQDNEGDLRPGTGLIPDVAIRGLRVVQTTGERLDWNIHADEARLFERENKIVMTAPKVDLHTDGGLVIEFGGDVGVVNTKTQDFDIHNELEDMAVHLSNGYTVMTRGLDWNQRERRISSTSPVVIQSEQWSIRGDSLQIDTLNEEMSVRGEVHGAFESSS